MKQIDFPCSSKFDFSFKIVWATQAGLNCINLVLSEHVPHLIRYAANKVASKLVNGGVLQIAPIIALQSVRAINVTQKHGK